MKENREKEKDERGKDKESGVVTRESVSAVCALFSALAFFILCTRSLIFGNIGVAVNSFLLGVFGYLAYPVLLGWIYLSVTAFIGMRFVRNRKIAAAGSSPGVLPRPPTGRTASIPARLRAGWADLSSIRWRG